jgi:hypothetical protein
MLDTFLVGMLFGADPGAQGSLPQHSVTSGTAIEIDLLGLGHLLFAQLGYLGGLDAHGSHRTDGGKHYRFSKFHFSSFMSKWTESFILLAGNAGGQQTAIFILLKWIIGKNDLGQSVRPHFPSFFFSWK